MNKQIHEKRLMCSFFLSSVVHIAICLVFVLSSALYSVVHATENQIDKPVNIDYVFEVEKKEEIQKEEVKVEENEEIQSEKNLESFNEPLSVDISGNVSEVDENLSSKIVKLGYYQPQSLQEFEEIKNYFHEMHILKFCPTHNDMLVIDSYVNNSYHIVHNPTKQDFKGYSFDTKSCDFSDFKELNNFVSNILRTENIDSKFSNVCIVLPMNNWIKVIDACEDALSKYNLTLNDSSVKRVVVKYVKVGHGWSIKPLFARISKGDRIVQINF